ncbi:hypothetical protein HK102_009506 [Quaeritorhiza haematococci]|nr:hypothetical protein HK102_009506 [Quaeritorhiza haematococci]
MFQRACDIAARYTLVATSLLLATRNNNSLPTTAFSFCRRRLHAFPKQKVIGTHSGSFHADEALAIYMLRQLPEFKDAEIVRTRDPEVLAKADMVVDVGGEYAPERLRFDHHQRSFTETFSAQHLVTKLSSAGLIYKHYGKAVIGTILGWPHDMEHEEKLAMVYQKVYTDIIEGFDAIDNGVSQYPSGVSAKYRESTNISSRVGKLNPWWNEKGVDVQERFLKAVELTGLDFTTTVRYIATAWLPAREIVQKSIKESLNVHASGKILLLSTFCPWKEHLSILEDELKIEKEQKPLYVLYPDESGSWRIQAVPMSPESFER